MADFHPHRSGRDRLPGLLATAVSLLSAAMLAVTLAAPVSAAQGRPPLDEPAIPVRIQVPDLGIDLPVVSSERTVPGNSRDYPLCDVAQYWTIYDLPGAPGTTWIYAHAQPGMFLPIFLTADATTGAGLLGKSVLVQLRDGRLLRYRIDEVKQHALNRRIAKRPRPSQQRLVLQTSEGPPGTVPKLQVAAQLVEAEWTDERAPAPKPRACWQPRAATTSNGDRNGRPSDRTDDAESSPEPAIAASIGTDDPLAGASLVLGGAAVLLGATLFAVYLVRRPPSSQQRRA
ncbi:MAG TPA: sortase [Candidatus Limnocylindrales bacterium]|nr:sortase [Candidatus Limnocylindrales bacterium]